MSHHMLVSLTAMSQESKQEYRMLCGIYSIPAPLEQDGDEIWWKLRDLWDISAHDFPVTD